MNLPLLALAIAAFGIGTTEFVIMGLLPEVAQDLTVSIPQAGLLITAYALGVTLGGPLLALTTARLPRKATLIVLMLLFVAGNLGCAMAPNYQLLLVARVVTSFCHAAFFGIGAVVAGNMVEPSKRSQAMALMFTGLTLANVLGVPLGTLLGQFAGWRSTFWAVTVIGIIAVLALARWVPHQHDAETPGLAREFRVFRAPQIWIALGMSVLSSVSMFTVFTYITPILRDVTGVSPHAVTIVLLLCGVGLTVGNLIGGKLADWRLMPSLMAIFVVLALVLFGFGATSAWPISATITVVLWGAVSFAALAPLQTRVIRQASAAPNLASTLNIGAFNLGNAIGAWLGGRVIEHGYALNDLPAVGALAALAALGLTVYSAWIDRRAAPASLTCADPG